MSCENMTISKAAFAIVIAAAFASGYAGHDKESHARSASHTERPAGATVVDFESMAIGKASTGFTEALPGGGGPVAWRIAQDGASNHVLAQTSTDDTDYRFPVCVADGF